LLRIKRIMKPYLQIQSVLLIWDASQNRTDIEEIKIFGHELRKAGKDITFLAFHPIKKLTEDMMPNEIYKLCCKADFNFFLGPKSINLRSILSKKYDLMINGCLTENNYMKTMATFCHAQFRIGPYIEESDINFYEIMIKPNGADPCENYLIEVGKCLRKII